MELISVADGGGDGNGDSTVIAITPNGRFVLFFSNATNLTAISDSNGRGDLFVRDRQLGVTHAVTVNQAGTDFSSGDVGQDATPLLDPPGDVVSLQRACDRDPGHSRQSTVMVSTTPFTSGARRSRSA